MQPAGKKEQFWHFWFVLYFGIVMEDWTLGAPRDHWLVNVAMLVIAAAVAGVLYLIRRRRSVEAA